jgi:phosphate butyryltransferase
MLKTLKAFTQQAKENKTRTIAVVAANDNHVLQAIKKATEEEIIKPLLFGKKEAIQQICAQIKFSIPEESIIDVLNDKEAANQAVKSIYDGKADILMKGLISTGSFLKAVINKEYGLLSGGLLSHVAFFESPYYHKICCITDAAMNVAPDFKDKQGILNNAINAYHSLGISNPKVAVLAAVETLNPKMEATVHAAMLNTMGNRKQIKGCTIDGPLALDNAISKKAAQLKGIDSEVAGDADILLVPEINTGNVLYKSLNFLGGAKSAALIMGAKAPIVLTSRADNEDTKFYSIALAAAMK